MYRVFRSPCSKLDRGRRRGRTGAGRAGAAVGQWRSSGRGWRGGTAQTVSSQRRRERRSDGHRTPSAVARSGGSIRPCPGHGPGPAPVPSDLRPVWSPVPSRPSPARHVPLRPATSRFSPALAAAVAGLTSGLRPPPQRGRPARAPVTPHSLITSRHITSRHVGPRHVTSHHVRPRHAPVPALAAAAAALWRRYSRRVPGCAPPRPGFFGVRPALLTPGGPDKVEHGLITV